MADEEQDCNGKIRRKELQRIVEREKGEEGERTNRKKQKFRINRNFHR